MARPPSQHRLRHTFFHGPSVAHETHNSAACLSLSSASANICPCQWCTPRCPAALTVCAGPSNQQLPRADAAGSMAHLVGQCKLAEPPPRLCRRAASGQPASAAFRLLTYDQASSPLLPLLLFVMAPAAGTMLRCRTSRPRLGDDVLQPGKRLTQLGKNRVFLLGILASAPAPPTVWRHIRRALHLLSCTLPLSSPAPLPPFGARSAAPAAPLTLPCQALPPVPCRCVPPACRRPACPCSDRLLACLFACSAAPSPSVALRAPIFPPGPGQPSPTPPPPSGTPTGGTKHHPLEECSGAAEPAARLPWQTSVAPPLTADCQTCHCRSSRPT